MHHVDQGRRGTRSGRPWTSCVTQGKVIYVGSSNFAGWHIARAQEAAGAARLRAGERAVASTTSRANGRAGGLPACQRYGMGSSRGARCRGAAQRGVATPGCGYARVVWGARLQGGAGGPGGAAAGGAGGPGGAGGVARVVRGARLRVARVVRARAADSGGRRPRPSGRRAHRSRRTKRSVTTRRGPGRGRAGLAAAPARGDRPDRRAADAGPADRALRALEATLDAKALGRLDEIFPGPGGAAPGARAW